LEGRKEGKKVGRKEGRQDGRNEDYREDERKEGRLGRGGVKERTNERRLLRKWEEGRK
jgi:hypothetical protein